MTSVHEIKNRLLRVIDKDGSVLNLPVVMELIGVLEKTSISRDELEETRIGKYINDVRRAAKDVSLQKRAKKLIKSWQQMISSTVQTTKKNVVKPSPTDSFKRVHSSPSISNDFKNNKHVSSNNINGGAKSSTAPSKKNAFLEKDHFNKKNAKTKMESKPNMAKSQSAQSLTEVAKSSFTCKPNGLKMKFSNLSSSSSHQLPSGSDVSIESQRAKRKRKEESRDTKPYISSAELKPNFSNLSPKRTPVKKDFEDASQTTLRKSNFNHAATVRTSVYKSSSPPDVAQPARKLPPKIYESSRDRMVKAGEIGDAILSSAASRQFGNELAGLDGCRTNDGVWHSWSDSFVVRRSSLLSNPEMTDESEHLSIFPYVELD